MTQPSKGAAAFLTLFGLPFLCAGLAFIYAQLVSRGNFGTFEFAMGIMGASVFVFIGGGPIDAPFPGDQLLKAKASREESYTQSPLFAEAALGSPPADDRLIESLIACYVRCI